ncbi:MAG TPA: hypothetical protein VK002_01240 [Rubricoccaceae bacterium]|nr:hypothetical protein [Rubricoccaceae bacterium]
MPDLPDLSVTEARDLASVTKVRGGLRALAARLRNDLKTVEDPRAKALFETAAETLGELLQAFEGYEHGGEPAGRDEDEGA